MVKPRVVKTGNEMRSAGARSGDAHAKVAREFGVGARHEGGHLLMSGLDKIDFTLGAVQRAEHAVDAIAGIAEDFPHAPGVQALYDEVADRLRHGSWSPVSLAAVKSGARAPV